MLAYPAIRITKDFLIVVGGATSKSTHGCELWINAQLPIKRQDLNIAHHEPTILVTVIKGDVFALNAVVFHAPHTLKPKAFIRSWWAHLFEVLHRVSQNGLPFLFLMDSNADVGSNTSAAIGGCAPAVESYSGMMLHQLLTDTGMCLPSTVEHQGTPYTWRKHRYDFVAIPEFWRPCVTMSYVDLSIDLMAQKEDHAVSALEFW